MADNKNVIPNGLLASEMRNRMEDKNTLAQKGSMYAGTGVMGGNGAAVTTFTPPPSENSLLVKDDSQEGGLNWKDVSDVIGSADAAGQTINANNATTAKYIYASDKNINIAQDNPTTGYQLGFNERTLQKQGKGVVPSNASCSKIIFYNGEGTGAKTDIEAKNFIGNLTGNADYANTTSFSDDFIHVPSGTKYKFEENSLYLLKISVSGNTMDLRFTTLFYKGLASDNAIVSPVKTNATTLASYDWVMFNITDYTDSNYDYNGSIISAIILQYDIGQKTFELLNSGINVSYDLKKIK